MKRMRLSLIIIIVFLGAILLFLVGRGLHVLYSVGSYEKYWKTRVQESPAQNAIWYVALGDSTAQAIGASQPTKGYVSLIADYLEKKHNRPVHIINLSVTGAKTGDVIKGQLPEFKKLKLPDDTIITLGIGSNNLKKYDENVFKKEFAQILSELPDTTVVSDIPYFGGGRFKKLEPWAVNANGHIAELVKDKGMRLAPLHTLTKENDSWRIYGGDFFHPSDYAYRIWQKAFVSALEQ